MLGIGGALHQNSFLHPPPAEKHMKNVRRLLSVGVGSKTKGGGGNPHEPSSSSSSSSSSDGEKSLKRKRESTVPLDRKKKKTSSEWIPMTDVIMEGKKKLQSGELKNGVTFAFIGSSGCGKSTLIRKVFIDDLFTVQAKKVDKKEFLIQVFTESSKSDAFQGMDKNILVDGKGLDEDNINWCYHMNEKYDKKYNFMIILDDVLDLQYKKLVKRMFLVMRNTNISSLVSLQYPNLIPKPVRTSVYFTVLFYFNTDEAIELVVRGWLSAYLPGKNIREKMLYYRRWTKGEDGHQMFLVDNLNHKCYAVKGDYTCRELPMITATSSPYQSFLSKDGKRREDRESIYGDIFGNDKPSSLNEGSDGDDE